MFQKKAIEVMSKFIKEGKVKFSQWLLQTSTLLLLILVCLFIIIDIITEKGAIARYSILVIFLIMFIRKDIQNYWSVKYLERINRELKNINVLTEAMRSTMKFENLLDLIFGILTRELDFERVFIFLVETEKEKQILRGISGIGVSIEELKKINFPMDEKLGIIPRTAIEKKQFIIRDAKNDYRCEQKLVETFNLSEFVSIPLEARSRIVGVIVVDKNGKSFSDSELELLTIFSNHAAIAIENARLYEWVELLSNTDGLTGLFNHRYFYEHLVKEIRRAERLKGTFSLIFMDIDYFKHYNDTNGHQAGDNALRLLANIVKGVVRDTDIPARYGGEEFAIILPGTDKEGAFILAEKIRKEIEDFQFEYENKQPNGSLTVSLGLSNYPTDTKTAADLVRIADDGLYKAKKEGKNRVCII